MASRHHQSQRNKDKEKSNGQSFREVAGIAIVELSQLSSLSDSLSCRWQLHFYVLASVHFVALVRIFSFNFAASRRHIQSQSNPFLIFLKIKILVASAHLPLSRSFITWHAQGYFEVDEERIRLTLDVSS